MPKFPNKIWVRQLQRKGERFFKSKNILTFSLFLLLSFSFWFVNALSALRQSEIVLSVNYSGISQDVKVLNALPETIDIKIKDEGLKLFAYNKRRLQEITIDLSDKIKSEDARLHINAQEIERAIAATLLPTTELISFFPEFISSDYVHLAHKKVPVTIAVEASPAPQYIFTTPIKVSPDTISILGSRNDINKITQVCTEYITLIGLKKSLSQSVNLQPIENVRLSQTAVDLQISVERFTEKIIDIPITFRHVPDNINVRTFPAKISATFNVSMSQFSNITQNDIQLVFDFNDLKGENTKRYKLRISNNCPEIISNLKVVPEEVEFLLESK